MTNRKSGVCVCVSIILGVCFNFYVTEIVSVFSMFVCCVCGKKIGFLFSFLFKNLFSMTCEPGIGGAAQEPVFGRVEREEKIG